MRTATKQQVISTTKRITFPHNISPLPSYHSHAKYNKYPFVPSPPPAITFVRSLDMRMEVAIIPMFGTADEHYQCVMCYNNMGGNVITVVAVATSGH